ncbi:hypothetical protein KIH74_19645 [Kineosporia sp. J2-2]|uniref:Uncharacterized protein n=1 Tax=Kineosporia corallincola TaxID=2835133 RepID=A0ABS5TLC1_9ACTN|nr:hypothetical protein [Kineosporia corallincola]MBT0771164.1 hypothetical protein [Kineosporia corallincola]
MGRRHLLLTAVLLGAGGLAVPLAATAATGSDGLDRPLGPAVVASLDPTVSSTPTPYDVSAAQTPTPATEDDEEGDDGEADDGDDEAESVDVPEVDDADDEDEADEEEADENEPDEDEPDEDGSAEGDDDDDAGADDGDDE